MSGPKIYLKVGNEDEICLTDKISGLTYLGQSDSSSSPQITNNYQQISGLDGSQFLNQTFDKRTINEQFSLDFMDYEDLVATKHEIYRLFASRQLIRIRHSDNMAKCYFAYPLAFDIAPFESGANTANFTIPFDNPSGYWFSVNRSDKVHDFDGSDVAFAMGFPNENIGSYQYNSLNFNVYNPSDIAIDPYFEHHDMKIKFSFSGGSFNLRNNTNNTGFNYKKSYSGQLTYDGLNVYKNNGTSTDDNMNENSDYGTITLAPGNNSFTVSGCSSANITFSFPFIYLI
ncbi:phage tail domain-containing protein [Limosilactobacillus sp.]|uniref:phage tail domain-containing protein n=1 Tax=Limosilactobacillus sp. TaxID=2773925 RepID=UPI002A824269|nr:phage tail domain-containing protein [Limosilactobacillus sp.]MDY4865170.1 phage tail family protein [Limosilactobacillus sp.]